MPWRGTAALATALAGWLVPGGPGRADPPGGGGSSRGVVPQPSLELLGGEVRNVSDSCGRPRTLTVQFLGPVSPRLQLAPGASEPVSLARGFYQATIQTPDGIPEESPFVVVERKGFFWAFGCPPVADPEASSRAHDDSNPGPTVLVRFANTTADCGEPRPVVFILNGTPAATVLAGGSTKARVPAGEVLMEVVSIPEGRRLLVRRLDRVALGETLYYGCTDPDFASREDGVAVVFENATDTCPSPGPLTLFVDGRPRVGLLPGRAKTLAVPKGLHDFEVREGLSLTRLLQGSRNVQTPFRIRYGCSKED